MYIAWGMGHGGGGAVRLNLEVRMFVGVGRWVEVAKPEVQYGDGIYFVPGGVGSELLPKATKRVQTDEQHLYQLNGYQMNLHTLALRPAGHDQIRQGRN